MDNSEEKARSIPPYASFTSFVSLLDWLNGMGTMPARIDRSLWASKFSGATGSALISGARFLRLLDGEQPTQLLDELVRADAESRKSVIEQMLRSAYGNEIVDGASTMTPKMFDDHLRGLGASDATHRKAASFLTNALKEAGVDVQPAIAKRARNRRAGATRRTSSRKSNSDTQALTADASSTDAHTSAADATSTRNARTLTLRNGETVSLVTESDMLSLPAEDLEWLLSVVRMFDDYARKISEKGEQPDEEEGTDE